MFDYVSFLLVEGKKVNIYSTNLDLLANVFESLVAKPRVLKFVLRWMQETKLWLRNKVLILISVMNTLYH